MERLVTVAEEHDALMLLVERVGRAPVSAQAWLLICALAPRHRTTTETRTRRAEPLTYWTP